jgi:2-oxoglutarate ferredoxin oxidoreductase subunit beta
MTTAAPPYRPRDFASDQQVRWCPGCGDYAILHVVQSVFASLGIPREQFVVVSGIGCASRLPYYLETYGFHTLHGRAPAIATGLALTRPELSVWVVTGDGDALSIGGNHLIHCLRRNVGVKILLFNNQVYGLTKGQYSPTSPRGMVSGSTPFGSVDAPLDPLRLALGAGATFVARTVDVLTHHLEEVLHAAATHRGAAFVEIYQNCNIFNDGAFDPLAGRDVRHDALVELHHGERLRFGKELEKGIVLTGAPLPAPVVATVAEVGEAALLVHDAHRDDATLAFLLAGMAAPALPVPIGIFRQVERPTFEEGVAEQISAAIRRQGPGDLAALLAGAETWEVE